MDRVWECLYRGDDDAVAGVHAERVDVLHGADRDAGVLCVAHHLVLDLLPADEAAFNHHLPDRACAKATAHTLAVLLFGHHDPAARAAERECGAHNRGETDLRECCICRRITHTLVGTFNDRARCNRLADAITHCTEELAIFGHADGGKWRAEQANWMTIEDASIGEGDGEIECRLPAEPSEESLGSLALDDPLDHLNGQWLEVDSVGHRWVGHDRCGIRVHENRTDPFGTKCATGLRAGVVKLCSLANNDWP